MVPSKHQGKTSKTRWAEQIPAYLFLLPALVLFGLFAWYPMINSVIMSFQSVKLNGEDKFVGFDNYVRMFQNPNFGLSWLNSLQFALLSIVIGFIVPIAVAIGVNEMRRSKGFFRLVFFLPNLIPVVIYLLVWRLIYASDGGFLNSFLGTFGVEPQLWLQNPATVKIAVVVILTWANFGGTMLIYLAALGDLSPDLYEAAEIDGASITQRIWHITVPYLRTTMKLLLVLQFLTVVQLFTEPFLLTSGGPANNTLTPVLSIYRIAFTDNDFGLASAWSVTLVIFLAIFSAIYLRLSRSEAGD
ncbi:MAG: hypothetical protein BGO39_07995 [Chloroflexi bacterium 54-19]|nr:MAG: hypothetical protein BGO39_07995 [Chloroflexi bacterium 54-19]